MECFAAFLSYTDEQIGRVLAFIEDLGETDRTVVIIVSDNGASSEGGNEGTINEGRLSNFEGAGVGEMYARLEEIGGPRSHNNYPWGWTMAGNTPFKRWKREVHEGGVADPCIVRLPATRRGSRRWWRSAAVCARNRHRADCAPAGGHRSPGGDRGNRPVAPRRHQLRLLARRGRRGGARSAPHPALRDARLAGHLPEGWKAVTYHPVGPIYDDGLRSNAPWEDDIWELYNVTEDVSESRDRAAEFPEKVTELVALWWEEARRNDVFRSIIGCWRPSRTSTTDRRLQATYRYFQDGAPVPSGSLSMCETALTSLAVLSTSPRVSWPTGTLLALDVYSVAGPFMCRRPASLRAQPVRQAASTR